MNLEKIFISFFDNRILMILFLLSILIFISNNKHIIKNESFTNAQPNMTSSPTLTPTLTPKSSPKKDTQLPKSCNDLLNIKAVQERIHNSLVGTPCKWNKKKERADQIIQNFNVYVTFNLPMDDISNKGKNITYAFTIIRANILNQRMKNSPYKVKWSNNKLQLIKKKGNMVTKDDLLLKKIKKTNRNDFTYLNTCCGSYIKKQLGINKDNVNWECTSYVPILERVKIEKNEAIAHNNVTLYTATPNITRDEKGECEYTDYKNNEFPVNINFNKHNPDVAKMYLNFNVCNDSCDPRFVERKHSNKMVPACVSSARVTNIKPTMTMCLEKIPINDKNGQPLKRYHIKYKNNINGKTYYLVPDINLLGQYGGSSRNKDFPNFGNRLDTIPLIFIENPYNSEGNIKEEYIGTKEKPKYEVRQNNKILDHFLNPKFEFRPQECIRSKADRGKRRR